MLERVITTPDNYEPFLLSQGIKFGNLLFISGQAGAGDDGRKLLALVSLDREELEDADRCDLRTFIEENCGIGNVDVDTVADIVVSSAIDIDCGEIHVLLNIQKVLPRLRESHPVCLSKVFLDGWNLKLEFRKYFSIQYMCMCMCMHC